jgi:DNA replication ATP-dependent helicase Dna2
MQGQALSTNLASIVERMKQSISNSQEQPPSGSSPPLDTGPAPIVDPESPLKRHTPRDAVEEETSGILQVENCAVEDELVTEDQDLSERCEGSQLAEEQQQSCASSDDFGEVDFDADMADAAIAGTLETEASQIHPSVSAEPAPPLADSEDDFGIGDDDDIFAADLEQVASLFDNRPLESPTQLDPVPETAPAVSAVPVIDLVNDDSDDFGDDIDADEFAAAEIAATQTPATNTVCRARTSLNETV